MAETILARQQLTQQQLSVFCGSLAMMLHAGSPAPEALESLARERQGTFTEGETKTAAPLSRPGCSRTMRSA